MKKIIIDVKEKVINVYRYEVSLEEDVDIDDDIVDELGDKIEDEFRGICEAEDTPYIISDYLIDVLGLEENSFNIDDCVSEAEDVETEIDYMDTVGN